MPVNKIRRNGSYAPLSAHYYKDDAIAEAGEEAELLYLRGLAFCADVLSDGFISDIQLTRYAGVGMKDAKKRAERLVQVGLWLREENGYRIRTWLHWNASRKEIAAARERDAQRKGGKGGSSAPLPPPEPPDDSEQTPNGIHAESNGRPGDHPPGVPPDSTPRARTPRNSTTRNDKVPTTSGADAPPGTIHAGACVEAWVDAAKANDVRPTSGQRGQVGKLAKELLELGNSPDRVLAAAKQAGAKGFSTIDRELSAMSGRPLRVVQATADDPRRFYEQ